MFLIFSEENPPKVTFAFASAIYNIFVKINPEICANLIQALP